MATLNEDDIVISGISGKYPESDNVEELWENLINHKDMVTENDRCWNPDFLSSKSNIGKLKDLSQFDVDYFSKGLIASQFVPIPLQLLNERVAEAINDSGRPIQAVSNTKTSLYVGASNLSEPDVVRTYLGNEFPSYLHYTGFMGPNGISFFFDLKGQSIYIDTSCSSAFAAFRCAMDSLQKGESEYAIVGCSQILLYYQNFNVLDRIGVLSHDSSCYPFDEAANGYNRSDAVVAFFLEKAKTAKRVYGTVLNCMLNSNGYSFKGLFTPVIEAQEQLYKDTIKGCKEVSHLDVTYVEANALGTKAGDSAEISSISKVYCENRQEPLLVGSVKSNLGHAEKAAGMCSLTKAILIMEKGIIPSNLHFRKPSSKSPALHTGEIKVVSENTPWKGGLIAVNSFGIGGTNGHLILRPNLKEQTTTEFEKQRKLFAFTSRTKEGLEVILDYLLKNPDPNLYGLLGDIMDNPNPNMHWKGYTILNSEEPVKKMELVSNEKRPVCFVFTGFGCQWIGMGKDLMSIEFFRQSFVKCFDCLKPFGVDIEQLMENQDSSFNTMSWQSLTVLTAIQIAFTDILRTLEINPDYIIGYSLGETASAYADGCITREQTMLITYQKALEIVEHCPRQGMMAVATLSPEDACKRVPEGVAVACHNSEDSVTLAGEAGAVAKFMQELRESNIVVKKMETKGFAFHCKILDHSEYNYLTELQKIIPSPKPRSSKWISTSVPEKDWNTELAETFSPEYLINNFFEPVLFYEGLQHIPKNSIFIEIGPHNLLTPLLKRNAGVDAKYLSFMKKNADNINVMLTTIGQMYLEELNPKISKLYPSVSFPVPRGTPMISPLLRWDHSNPHKYKIVENSVDCDLASIYVVNMLKGFFGKVVDHNIKGQTFFPAAGYILIAWRKLAMKNFVEFDQFPVVFENVEILKNIPLKISGGDFFKITFLPVAKRFEIYHNDEICATGLIRSPDLNNEHTELDFLDVDANEEMISKDDVYKEFRFRGYNYGEDFQGLLNCNLDCTAGNIKWDNNWIQFLESMFQLQNLNHDSLDAFAFNGIEYLYIDPIKLKERISTNTDISVKFYPQLKHIQAGGIILRGASATKISQSEYGDQIVLDQPIIDPFFNDRCFAETSQIAEDLQHYKSICETYIIQILKGLKNVEADLIFKHSKRTCNQRQFDSTKILAEKFVKKPEYKTLLLEQLTYLVELADEPNKEFLTFVLNSEDKGDFLLTAFLNDFILRASLDIAMENIKTSEMNIIQISSPNVWLTKHLTSFFQSYTDVKVNYVVAESESWENEIVENFDLEWMDWDTDSSSLISRTTDIIISYHKLLANKNTLKPTLNKFKNALKVGGFVLVIEPKEDNIIGQFLNGFNSSSCSQNDLLEAIRAENFEIVAQKFDGVMHNVYLLRKVSETHFPITAITIGDSNFGHWLSEVHNTLASFQNKKIKGNIWLISRDTPTSGVIGIVKSLAKESGDRIRCLFEMKKDDSRIFTKEEIPKNVIEKDLLINIYQNGQWGSFRNVSVNKDVKVPLQKVVLDIKIPGVYESLYWTEADQHLKPDCPETYIYFAGLCNRDILSAERHQSFHDLHEMPHFGYDFSGRNATTGDKIMGITSCSAVATCVPCETKYTWKIPEHWTLAEAATVPYAYTLVYYALLVRGNLRNGEKILIDCPTEPEGQAAINVALSMFCDIYVTVGSQEKRNFLKKEYPALKEDNIFSSTDTDFELQVLTATKGKGVDVVLNSFTEERMIASLNCLAENGRFLNINNSGLPVGRNLDAALLQKKHIDINFDFLFKNNHHFQEVEKKFSHGLKTGVVKPIKSVVFAKDKIVEAFLQLKNQEKNIGKIVIKILEEENINLKTLPKLPFIAAVPRIQFHCNNTIIIVGGLNGFGMMLTRWLTSRGARNLILNSTAGIVNGYQKRCIHICRKSGINVQINNVNLADEQSAISLVEKANKMGSVIGIFNSSMVSEDDPKCKNNQEMLEEMAENEIRVTRNLDKASRSFCPHLKYFVIFSSVGVGDSVSQKSFAYYNAEMEKICKIRQDSGVPGLAIQLGWSGDRRPNYKTYGNEVGKPPFISHTFNSCVNVMDTLLNQKASVLSCYSLADKNKDKQKVNAEDFVGLH